MTLSRKAPTAAKKPGRPARLNLAAALAEREAELAEARRERAAAAEILRVISQTPTDPQPVFERIVATATRALRCDMAVMLVRDGDVYVHTAAATPEGLVTDFAPERFPIDPNANFPSRAFLAKTMLHLPDWSQVDLPKHERWIHETFGLASAVYLPLLRSDECVGVLVFAGKRANSFGPGEIAQAELFRDQAMIAIENARLFNEVQAKTRDLEEALAQQTATADVLKVISRSAFDLDAVLKTLTDSARSLSGAAIGAVFMREGESMRIRAESGFPLELVEYARAHPIQPGRETFTGRVALTGEVVHIPDVLADPNYDYGEAPRLGDYRAGIGVPLMRAGRVDGVFSLMRPEPGAFTPRQIELVRTFADQALIAIENARLFSEVQAKTRDIEESLQQQTATAEILGVISSSLADTQPVFEAIVRSGSKLFPDAAVTVAMRDGDQVKAVATAESDPTRAEAWRTRFPFPLTREYIHGAAILDGIMVDIPDAHGAPGKYAVGMGKLLGGGYGAQTVVPMMRAGEPIGALSVSRIATGPLSEKQLATLKTFANQAVIAVENTRLLSELRESLAQQTATADVLKVISRSAFDLPAVLRTLVELAAKLCDADKATITRQIDGLYYRAESYGFSEEFMRGVRDIPVTAERGTVSGRALLEGAAIQVEDVQGDPEYTFKEYATTGEFRTCLAIPMLWNGVPIGVLVMLRTEVRPFNNKQVELVRTFADQAVIAIENARLFDEVQARTRDLEEALQQQTATADVLKVISRSTFDLDAVLKTLTDSARSLSGAATAVVFLRDGEVMRLRARIWMSP